MFIKILIGIGGIWIWRDVVFLFDSFVVPFLWLPASGFLSFAFVSDITGQVSVRFLGLESFGFVYVGAESTGVMFSTHSGLSLYQPTCGPQKPSKPRFWH